MLFRYFSQYQREIVTLTLHYITTLSTTAAVNTTAAFSNATAASFRWSNNLSGRC